MAGSKKATEGQQLKRLMSAARSSAPEYLPSSKFIPDINCITVLDSVQFKSIKQIGHGAFGTVYKVRVLGQYCSSTAFYSIYCLVQQPLERSPT